MPKQTIRTPKEAIAAKVNELATVTRHYTAPAAAPHTEKPKIDMTVTMGDIKTLAMTQLREKANAVRQDWEGIINGVNNDIETLKQELIDAGMRLIKGIQAGKEAVAMCDALNQWVSFRKETERYRILIAKRGLYRSYEWHKPLTDEELPEIDANRKVILGEIIFVQGRNTHIDELDTPFEEPFNAEMIEIVTKLKTKQEERDAGIRQLSKINRRIAELPHQGDVVQAMLTRAHLSGNLKDADDIIHVLDDCVKSIVLAIENIAPIPAERQLEHAQSDSERQASGD